VTPDGRIGHVELALGDSVLMITEEWPEDGLLAPVRRGGASLSLRLETPDPDGVVAAALTSGATLERPVTDEPYGRGGVVVDADGHRWIVSRGMPVARPGDIIYASLWAPDPDRTRRFFGDLLGDLGPLGTATAAAATLMCCYEVADIDAAVTVVRAAGGSAAEPRDEPHGRTADCVDDQGIPFALHAGPGTPPLGGPLAYVELRVPDEGRARAFYGTVLGWGFQPGSVHGYWHPLSPEGGFTSPMTGLIGGAAQARVVPTFRMPDVAAGVDAVVAAGGEVADRDPRGYGGAACVDDQGAPFHLHP
jgi:predicted enzyme related to lactoylglutathione lyase